MTLENPEFHPLMARIAAGEYIEPAEFQNEIPVIDLKNYDSSNHELTQEVVNGLREIGFIFVKTPEVTPKLDNLYQVYAELFHQPEEVLLQYAHPEIHFQRGYTPGRQEAGIFCKRIGDGTLSLPDDKRGWFIGPNMDHNHPLVQEYPHFYPDNIFPFEVPEFEIVTKDLREELYTAGNQVMKVLEVALHKPDGYFTDLTQDSPSLLRSIHYPEVTEESWENSVWGCEHTDINLITVLPASTREGLWVQTRTGEWIKGMAPEGCSIVQVGDMLQYMTGGEFHSAHHLIMAPEGIGTPERFSSALFVHARSDWIFQVRGQDGYPVEGYPDITAADLLMKRLREIGLASEE